MNKMDRSKYEILFSSQYLQLITTHYLDTSKHNLHFTQTSYHVQSIFLNCLYIQLFCIHPIIVSLQILPTPIFWYSISPQPVSRCAVKNFDFLSIFSLFHTTHKSLRSFIILPSSLLENSFAHPIAFETHLCSCCTLPIFLT